MTYKQIQIHVRNENHFVPKTCWIADVLSKHHLTRRIAANRLDATSRKYPCPLEKRAAIERALQHFGMI
ncbi:MAG TPA: hypothetical protein VHZ29_09850 [Rhizomicrobium sp.]|jgi:hypothetical protein|nr:hypothetical protein [Rhizomicrobium sp.]